jgi:hypothetical protein
MSNYKDKSNEYYLMAMYDLANDVSIDKMQFIFADYERKEMYEACAGLKRAMETYGFVRYFYYIEDISSKTGLIDINFNKNND